MCIVILDYDFTDGDCKVDLERLDKPGQSLLFIGRAFDFSVVLIL